MTPLEAFNALDLWRYAAALGLTGVFVWALVLAAIVFKDNSLRIDREASCEHEWEHWWSTRTLPNGAEQKTDTGAFCKKCGMKRKPIGS